MPSVTLLPPDHVHRHLLPAANKVCKGYVFTSVCHSVHRCLGPGPGEVGGSGWGVSRPRPRGEVGGSGWGWWWCPGPQPGGVQAWGCVSQHALRQTPHPQQTTTAAGGMYPTGMHSCSQCYYVHWHLQQYLIQSSSLANRDAIFVDKN